MPRKPFVVTIRLDAPTRDRIRETVRYSPHRTSSAFIRAAIEQLLAREAQRPSGWIVRRGAATERVSTRGVSAGPVDVGPLEGARSPLVRSDRMPESGDRSVRTGRESNRDRMPVRSRRMNRRRRRRLWRDASFSIATCAG
jgi:hypothetical protein